jgi:hypothetical protein
LNVLQHRANEAMAKITSARTPQERHDARQQAISVKADLEKHLADDKAMAAFKAAQPQNSIGMYKDTVRDHPLFMVGPGGSKITATITLPDGSKATPNPQGQIVIPARLLPAMLARGFVQANSVMTNPDNPLRDPARPNNT